MNVSALKQGIFILIKTVHFAALTALSPVLSVIMKAVYIKF